MSQVGAHHNRAALVIFADLNFLFAPGRLEKDKLRAAAGSVAAHFLQAEDVTIK